MTFNEWYDCHKEYLSQCVDMEKLRRAFAAGYHLGATVERELQSELHKRSYERRIKEIKKYTSG